jgi:uncharacterized membrane protein
MAPAFSNPPRIVRKLPTTTTQLQLNPTLGASVALVGSSLVGLQVDRWVPSGGILGTLLVAAGCSNTGLVPSVHPLYDACWTWVLPASLALLLLAYRPPPNKNVTSSSSISSCIRRVAGPFGMASIGSLLGCWISYQCALQLNWFGSKEYAKAAAGCLAASYVGGSVNLFATAKLIGAHPNLLGSMATADLLAMAIYFSILSATLEWKWLRSKFRGNQDNNLVETPLPDDNRILTSDETTTTMGSKLLASVPLLGVTWVIVLLANMVDTFMSQWIPGMACAFIAVVAPLLNSLVNQRTWWTPFPQVASPLGDFLFLTFFASIGMGANLQSALQLGPACLLFSVLALSIHLMVAILGSLPLSVELEDVWIASNAAIGGPATAAAFCSRMRKDPAKLRGRTLAATVWGVVGYAIGTSLGVTMYRLLGGGTMSL